MCITVVNFVSTPFLMMPQWDQLETQIKEQIIQRGNNVCPTYVSFVLRTTTMLFLFRKHLYPLSSLLCMQDGLDYCSWVAQ